MKTIKVHLANFFISLVFFATFSAQAINLKNGNAAIEVVIPNAIPAVFEASPSGGDATLVLRFTTLLANSWYDATAPYHPTAIGVYSSLGRRPANESDTNLNMNISLLFASYRVLNSIFPAKKDAWAAMLRNEGLNPNNNSQDLSTPEGIGNVAGNKVVQVREHDGMNQLGDEGNQAYHHAPYADYLQFKPVNSAYKLRKPSNWQPAITTDGHGIFKVQQFVTPQLAVTKPYSYRNPRYFRAPRPRDSNVRNFSAYVNQANEVLEASANLTDEQKIAAELFNNKIFSLGFSTLFAAQSNQMTLLEFIQYDFLVNIAAFDTSIAIWKEKSRHNAVRPFSAIAYIHRSNTVTAWGGPGLGTVNDMPANQWKSYLDVADHPEYPSASASFCAAHAEASRLFLGTDELNYTVQAPQGSSVVEPGITPATDIELYFATWSDLEETCGISRFWAGVHFRPSIPAGQNIGTRIGRIAHKFLTKKINGH